MIQAELYTEKITSGGTQSIAALQAADTGHTYSIHSIIFLGAYDDAKANNFFYWQNKSKSR